MAADPQWRQADEALLNLARAWQKLNRQDAAKAVLSRLIADFPQSNQLAAAHYQLAQGAFASQDFAAATAEYALVTANWSESPLVPHALYGQAWAQVRAGNFPQAIQPLNQLIAGFADSPLLPQAHQARAVCHQRTGKFQEGIADADRFLQSNPSRSDRSAALYVRGLCEMGLKQTDAAISTFQSILSEDTDYRCDQILYELAWAHKARNQPDEARELFRRLAEAYPTSSLAPEAHFHSGEWHYEQGEYEPALEAYNLALKGSPTPDLQEKVLYKIGWTNFQQKQYQPALQAFTQQLAAYASGPLAADGLFMKAECLFHLEDYAQALPAFKNAGAARPASETMAVLTLLHGGQSAGQLGNWDEALKWLTRLSDKYPDSPYLAEALYEQGWALQQMGRTNEARERYQRVTETSRTAIGARARFMLGELYFEQKQFDNAIREFRLLIYGYGGDNAPDDVKAWQAKGGLEAGRCAAVLAGQAAPGETKQSHLDSAKKYLSYVREKHPQTEEATVAAQQLKQFGT